jgi:hypothetical protein
MLFVLLSVSSRASLVCKTFSQMETHNFSMHACDTSMSIGGTSIGNGGTWQKGTLASNKHRGLARGGINTTHRGTKIENKTK